MGDRNSRASPPADIDETAEIAMPIIYGFGLPVSR
jgi:hypothetical protein